MAWVGQAGVWAGAAWRASAQADPGSRPAENALKSTAGFDRVRSLPAGAILLPQGPAGEVAEWLKAHAWNACKG